MQLEIRGNDVFAPILKKWIPLTPEEKLRQEFIIRLIENYGYSVDQLGQDIQIKNRYKADIAIWKSKGDKQKNNIPAIIIMVECKADHLRIKEDDYLMGYKFASLINANFFIATNLKETKVFHVLQDNSPKKLEKLSDIPNASILLDEKTIIKYINDTKAFTRDEFSKLLFKCHNIIRNNDKLSPEAAFDEISKILFMKIMYERKSKEEIIFSSEKFKTMEKDYEERLRPQLKINLPSLDKDFMQYLFDETKREFEDADIFDLNDQIKIRKNSFEMIVKELESFNLSDTSDDVKGIAFEQFLGKTFRGELGQFFTPRTIVDYMVEILDPEEGETICDPCCGSGGFLIKTFEFIRDKIDTDIKSKKDIIKKEYFDESYAKSSILAQNQTDKTVQKLFEDLHKEFDLKTPGSRYYNLSHNCIYGIDANPRMARTAKMNMIMHGDGHGGVHHHDGLLPVNGIFDNRFDIILTNPPFGARVEKTQRITTLDLPTQKKVELSEKKYSDYYSNVVEPLIRFANANKEKGTPLLEIFDLGRYSSLTEVLFIEKSLKLLKPGGRMGIVLPEGVLNNNALQKVRDYVEGKAKIINITSIPQDVFIASGATVKPSLVFFKKFTVNEQKEYEYLKREIENKINILHQETIHEIQTQYSDLKELYKSINDKTSLVKIKKEEKQKINQIILQVEKDIKIELKKEFNYSIPIVEVKKAGISSTGATIDNELIPVADEFKQYRKNMNLWDNRKTISLK